MSASFRFILFSLLLIITLLYKSINFSSGLSDLANYVDENKTALQYTCIVLLLCGIALLTARVLKGRSPWVSQLFFTLAFLLSLVGSGLFNSIFDFLQFIALFRLCITELKFGSASTFSGSILRLLYGCMLLSYINHLPLDSGNVIFSVILMLVMMYYGIQRSRYIAGLRGFKLHLSGYLILLIAFLMAFIFGLGRSGAIIMSLYPANISNTILLLGTGFLLVSLIALVVSLFLGGNLKETAAENPEIKE